MRFSTREADFVLITKASTVWLRKFSGRYRCPSYHLTAPVTFPTRSQGMSLMRFELSIRPRKRRALPLGAFSYGCALILPMALMLISCQGQKAASAPPAPEAQVAGVVQQDALIY